jgi:hypothetical protein
MDIDKPTAAAAVGFNPMEVWLAIRRENVALNDVLSRKMIF